MEEVFVLVAGSEPGAAGLGPADAAAADRPVDPWPVERRHRHRRGSARSSHVIEKQNLIKLS